MLVWVSVCLGVCLFGSFYPINVKTAEPIGPKFCEGPQGRFIDAQNYKSLYPKAFDYCEILKLREKIWLNLRAFCCCYCFIFTIFLQEIPENFSGIFLWKLLRNTQDLVPNFTDFSRNCIKDIVSRNSWEFLRNFFPRNS